MDVSATRIQIADLQQDYESLKATLHAPASRRVAADIIDVSFIAGIAYAISLTPISPWVALLYLVFRDAIPFNRSCGKFLLGVRIYSSEEFRKPSRKQLLIRGLANCLFLIPLGLFVVALFTFVFGALAFAGVLVVIWRTNSVFLQLIGYDFETGQTVADRIAGTHVILPSQLTSLTLTKERIEELRQELAVKEKSLNQSDQ